MGHIKTEDLCHRYAAGGGFVWALDHINLDIGRGAFAAVVGPSGSGKSTLLTLLGCLGTATAGRYHLGGRDVSRLGRDGRAALRSREIGFVFQNFSLLPRSTALENVEMPLLYAGVSATERRRRALAVLERVGLADRLRHTPGKLSGGQQQRVAIARALVNEPALLLADEPTGALDTQTSRDVMSLFQEIHRRDGATIVVVTHDQNVASFADRMIRLRDGRVVSDEVRPPHCQPACAVPVQSTGARLPT